MSRRNNFDALRLLAAMSVMFSHSFLIAEGTQKHEWLIRLTGNQSILGLTGVFVFFAISGFLVTQSFEQTGDPLRFVAKRALRIFPGLFVADRAVGFRAGATRHDPAARRLFQPAGALPIRRRQHLARSDRARIAGRHVRQQPGRAGDKWLDVDLAHRVHDVRDGPRRLACCGCCACRCVLGCWRSASPACISTALDFLGGWGWLLAFFAAGMILYKLRAHPHLRWSRSARWRFAGLVAQRAVAPVHPAIPAIWLLSGPLAGAQPALCR